MKQTFLPFQNLSSADKVKAIVILIFMGVLLVILGFLVGMLLRPRQFELLLPALSAQATPTSFVPVTAPSAITQSRECTPSTLVLGTTKLQIQDLPRGADGSLAVPGDTSGIAYRLAGTESSAVFVLSPTPQNIAVMSTISIGSAATVMEDNCTTLTYKLSAPQTASLDDSMFSSGTANSITVFFPTVSSNEGFVFKGTWNR